MKIEITFNNTYARSAEYYLRKRYNSKANLDKLVRVAITREVADEAQKELNQIASEKASS